MPPLPLSPIRYRIEHQLIVPLILNSLCDAESQPVKLIGEDTQLCLAERKMRAFGEIPNGGFKSEGKKMFQKA